MKKNKKIEKIHFPIPTMILMTLIVIFALSLMKIEIECSNLGKEIITQEKEIKKINNRLIRYQEKWSNITSPRSLQQIIKHHGLLMKRPDSTQVVRIERGIRSEALGINLN